MTSPHHPDPRRILCLGMPVLDMTFRVADVPVRGAKIQASRLDRICGGNAPNAAVAIARLGGRARLAGPMGDAGEHGMEFVSDQLGPEGIETQHLVHVAGAVTPVSTILIDATGERTGITYRDPTLWTVELPASDLLLDGVDAILTENRCASFVVATCAAARDRGLAVVVDADRAMPADEPLLQVATHVIFSAEALRATAGADDLTAALRRLAGLTKAFLAVTDGDQGAFWLDRDGAAHHTPAFHVQAVDTLGAGDVFHGAFALAIAEGSDLEPALRFAAAAAALKCSRFGGAFAAPQRPEVEAFLTR
ncbi:MAG: PfkB family carbohydrate kinase [Xanthobacteraceae bacterium]|nr:PfkB family carbohydrate kinase [Xanthobacteraceae bacterium]